ncbi:histone deacetylase [Pseudoalteromonas sp. 20-92]|uniref:histone deacetylase family protein n=1 Tax=Pseudoalteromonas sp. 20-92 TaxID=2969394 RepID=UPI0027AF12C7|nr:histone deacetylase [Pseudoalteromonas sp. 20-92]MDQ2042812.1 histone deacetylase [Pseudoalteromonas sp. 20-92]
MKIIYEPRFNYQLGLLKYLHPFDGEKFAKVITELDSLNIEIIHPMGPVSSVVINEYLNELMRKLVLSKTLVFRALEVPKIPFVSFDFLDNKILLPMRLAVAGTLLGAEKALGSGDIMWNLSGGFHHASNVNMEGFCIYNDIGISYQQLRKNGQLSETDKVLIIDVDAHHGNGNAYSFKDNENIHLLDVYNADIYPTSDFTRNRVNFPVPLKSGVEGHEYLEKLNQALKLVKADYSLAFVIAGTDVLAIDKLGGFKLTVKDVAEREKFILSHLKSLEIPTVVTGGGGYSKQSALAITAAIKACSVL